MPQRSGHRQLLRNFGLKVASSHRGLIEIRADARGLGEICAFDHVARRPVGQSARPGPQRPDTLPRRPVAGGAGGVLVAAAV